MTRPYGARVMGTGGFASLTTNYRMAEDIAQEGRPVVVLHVGDHDPSGTHLYQAMKEDVEAFVAVSGGTVSFERVAVTPSQQAQYSLPTAPPKPTDKRSFSGLTVQAEALDPADLSRILAAALQRHHDPAIEAQLRGQFESDRDAWVPTLTTNLHR